MSWFGGGGKSDNNGAGSYQPESSYQQEQNYVGQQEAYAAPKAAAGSQESFQQELLMEQQKALIQAVMFKLTETAFKKCVTNPSTSLSSTEASCIKSVTGKFLDASQLIVGRLSQQQQQ